MFNVFTIPENVMFPSYIESKIVNVLLEKPNDYVLIEKNPCACGTRDGIAVNNSSMFIDDGNKYIKAKNNYVFDFKTSVEDEDLISVVFWLSKSEFATFGRAEKTFECTLTEEFYIPVLKTCGCMQYELLAEPIYCLVSEVISSRKRGKTIRSVI